METKLRVFCNEKTFLFYIGKTFYPYYDNNIKFRVLEYTDKNCIETNLEIALKYISEHIHETFILLSDRINILGDNDDKINFINEYVKNAKEFYEKFIKKNLVSLDDGKDYIKDTIKNYHLSE